MDKTYVESRGSASSLTNARVTLDALVYAYWDGHSPETMTQAFCLDHEQVYGALAFYLGHRQEVDAAIRELEARQDALRDRLRTPYPDIHQKLAAATRA